MLWLELCIIVQRESCANTQSISAYTRFFAPLALQAASQGLTYPLVAMVASRGPGGPLDLAGLAQSNTLMYMLGTFGFGLVTAGMVFGGTRKGYRQFRAVTLGLGLLVTLFQALLCLPRMAHLLFGLLIGLPPSIEDPAAMTLMATVPLQFLFFIRIPYQVAMYNARATGKASLATILRILLTAILSPLFCMAGAVGPLWAVVCLSVPVGLEVAASAWLARPYLARMIDSETVPTKKRFFCSIFPCLSGATCFPCHPSCWERSLRVHQIRNACCRPIIWRLGLPRRLPMAPPGSWKWCSHFRRRLSRTAGPFEFAVAAGAVLGLLPLLFILPGLSDLYYVRLQNLDPGSLPLVRVAALALALYPMCVAVRAQGEGIASRAGMPMIVIAGQAMFMITILLTGGVLLVIWHRWKSASAASVFASAVWHPRQRSGSCFVGSEKPICRFRRFERWKNALTSGSLI